MVGMAVHKFSFCFAFTDQWASEQQCMEVRKAITHEWKVTKMKRKLRDYNLRNYHRIKTTQPIAMILVSFFSEDNVLSDEIKICFFKYKSNENQAFLLFWDTRYRGKAPVSGQYPVSNCSTSTHEYLFRVEYNHVTTLHTHYYSQCVSMCRVVVWWCSTLKMYGWFEVGRSLIGYRSLTGKFSPKH